MQSHLPKCLIYCACHVGWENGVCVLLACCNERSYLMVKGVKLSGGLRAVMKGSPCERSYLEKRLNKSKDENPVHDQGRDKHYIAPHHCIEKNRIRVPEHGGPQPAFTAWSSLGSKALNWPLLWTLLSKGCLENNIAIRSWKYTDVAYIKRKERDE